MPPTYTVIFRKSMRRKMWERLSLANRTQEAERLREVTVILYDRPDTAVQSEIHPR